MRKLLNEELERLSVSEFKRAGKIPVHVVLDNVRSQNNIGSVFRTSDAFLLDGITLCGITATPPHREIHKTALGATESVEWKYMKNTMEAVQDLKKKGYVIISVEQVEGAVALDTFQFRKSNKYALIFGHEVKGVAQEVVDQSNFCIEIPQQGTKHSLNVSVAAGVVLWEAYRQLGPGTGLP